MIICLVGTNTVRIAEEMARLRREVTADEERYDGMQLTENALADLLAGSTLFSTSRFIVIRQLSENSLVWERFGQWMERVASDTTLVLVEPKLDKRTKTYKALVKQATMVEVPQWTEREGQLAAEWVRQTARDMKVGLSPTQVTNMVDRAYVEAEGLGGGTIDQMRLYTALRALSVLDQVSDEAIATVMPQPAGEAIFDLIAIATEGNKTRVYAILSGLRHTEDAHKVFAMVASQWSQLVAVALAESSGADAARELGINPFFVRKLSSLAGQFTQAQLRSLTRLCADIDAGMKVSQFEPWDGVDRFVVGIALRNELPS